MFLEKPDDASARALMRRGALLNSMILAASGNALVSACEQRVPDVVEQLVGWVAGTEPDRAANLARVYETLGTHDFSREVLQTSVGRLRVVPVEGCGWTDVGTPTRLLPLLGIDPIAAEPLARALPSS
jgi:mannose-1-phosphate guanylyltransferase